jgi:hypothetical protein
VRAKSRPTWPTTTLGTLTDLPVLDASAPVVQSHDVANWFNLPSKILRIVPAVSRSLIQFAGSSPAGAFGIRPVPPVRPDRRPGCGASRPACVGTDRPAALVAVAAQKGRPASAAAKTASERASPTYPAVARNRHGASTLIAQGASDSQPALRTPTNLRSASQWVSSCPPWCSLRSGSLRSW